MTREEIGQFLQRRQDAWKRHDIEALTLDHAEDCVLDSPLAGKVKGRVAIARLYRALLSSFPDLAFDHTDVVIDEDRVVQIATMTGTNNGGFMDLPPTGKKISFPLVVIFRFKDGLIVEEQPVYDFTGMLVQAGVLKAKPL